MRNFSSVVVKKPSMMAKLYLMKPIVKLLMALGLCIFLCFSGSMVLYRQSLDDLSRIDEKKTELEKEVAQQAKSYGELGYLIKNSKNAKAYYASLINEFPPEFKIGDLLANITKIGTAEGLKFIYFKPGVAVDRMYYAEVPVDVSVVGSFHQIGAFLGGIANLSNSVVAVNKFSLTRADAEKGGLLTLDFTATLYHTLPTSLDVKP